jgi:peroxiredoxin
MNTSEASRLGELERRFEELEGRIEDSALKQALSVLHGMIQEVRRDQRRGAGGAARGRSLEDILNLYRSAPAMQGPARTQGLPPGTVAPDFTLPDANAHPVPLSAHRGHPVILVFYPLDWSPGCSQQLDLYQGDRAEFERRGARVLAVSVDSTYSHGAWAAVRGYDMPLLSDFQPKGEVARRYQVYREQDGHSDRALYLIDGQGVIRHAHVSPFLHHVPDIDDLFKALDALAGVPVPAGA